MPSLIPSEMFEDDYTARFKSRFVGRALAVHYDRDRATLDLGMHLRQLGTLELSGSRVWFQLKGIQATTLDLETFTAAATINIAVELDHLQFWYASPEAVYLVVYIQATETFLAEDVRDIVDREWGVAFLTPGSFQPGQKEVTVHVRTDAVLDEAAIERMLAHRSMRVDGPAFRGRPLGHRLDPLRSALASPDSATFRELVGRLLDVHQFVRQAELDLTELYLGGSSDVVEGWTGQLMLTYEWTSDLLTQYGYTTNRPGFDSRVRHFTHRALAP